MTHPRIIPVLLLHNGGLVKTTRFKNPRYIGDPINAVKIFNDKEVDEIIVINMDATSHNIGPDYNFIKSIVDECFMPLCYGGGITNLEQMRKIFNMGVEKLSISSAALENLKLISEAVATFGSQSIVVTLDIRKNIFNKYKITSHNNKKKYNLDLFEYVKILENHGIGELMINYVNGDGMMSGYNVELLKKINSIVKVPVIALGGAGSLSDIKNVFSIGDVSAAAAGSLFVYNGVHKAVLINYPGHFNSLDEINLVC